jgi:hypothetical protein
MMRRTTIVVGWIASLVFVPIAKAQEKPARTAEAPAPAPKQKPAPAAEDAAVNAQLDRRLPEINFSGQALDDVIDFLRDVSGANIFVEWKMLDAAGIAKAAPVTLRLKDVKFRVALGLLLESISTEKARAEFTFEDGTILITTAEDPKHPRPKVTVAALPPKLDRRLPEINFAGQGFADVIDFLRDVSGANIFVDWRALQKAGIQNDAPVTARLKDVRFSTALKRILEDVGEHKVPLQVSLTDNVITITTAPAPEKKAVDATPPRPENGGK